MDKRLTETAVALLRFTKQPQDKDFNFESLKQVLAPIYSYHMREVDVLRVLLKSYVQMTQIHELEMRHHLSTADLMEHLLLSPIHSLTNHPKRVTFKDDMTVQQFYSKMLHCMLSDIMLARVDWCPELMRPHATANAEKIA